ncbi:MAG TPA: hypothetical protein VG714_05210 [Acidobacteriaceae bacterium]|nr:hypothetical protein [Acidobacteriaceae bacterium]
MLSITLLIAFFAPFLCPTVSALTEDPEANLPACCRSHGAHHCAMMHWMLQQLGSRPTLTPAPCPLYPTAATAPQTATFTLAATPQLSIQFLHAAAPAPSSPHRALLVLALSRYDRGPPALLA